MSAEFDALAGTVFDWRSHLEGAPCLFDVPEREQRELIATYLQEHVAEMYDIFAYLHESEAENIAAMITGNIDGDRQREFSDAVFNAAFVTLGVQVDDRIALLYHRYCDEYGVYSLADKNGPEELIGWRCPNESI